MTATDVDVVQLVDLTQLVLEPDAIRRIPRSLALRHDILSLASEGNQITVALPNAADRDTIERIRLATGMHVHAVQASREAIRARLSDVYAASETAVGDEAPAVREVESMHARAVAAGASDIHIEPSHAGGRIRHRIDGILHETNALPGDLFVQVVSRIKLLAGMDIADRRQPQDGRYAIEAAGRSIDARVSSMPTIAGEKLAIRLLDHRVRIPTLANIGMPPQDLDRFRRAIHAPHGFIVVCGPTGSGKTTTLYAAMSERNVESQHLCSVEDPVEARIAGIAQVQINPRAGVTFASALRAFVRQDPNVIMVGEMRDRETASVAAGASLSGQLVMTTLHSSDAPSALDRLLELGVERHTIAAGLTAILAQRLLRVLCTFCKIRYALSAEAAREVRIEPGAFVYRAAGCNACGGRGFTGRMALFEAIFIDDVLRTAIAGGASSVMLRDMAGKRGYERMSREGVRRVLSGETSLDELRRVLSVEEAE